MTAPHLCTPHCGQNREAQLELPRRCARRRPSVSDVPISPEIGIRRRTDSSRSITARLTVRARSGGNVPIIRSIAGAHLSNPAIASAPAAGGVRWPCGPVTMNRSRRAHSAGNHPNSPPPGIPRKTAPSRPTTSRTTRANGSGGNVRPIPIMSGTPRSITANAVTVPIVRAALTARPTHGIAGQNRFP
jgi:hypothetical protein